jgi:hypothetical protein
MGQEFWRVEEGHSFAGPHPFDDRPGFRPMIGPRLAGGPPKRARVPIDDQSAVRVVVDLDEVAAPQGSHREAVGQQHVDDGSQRLRPALDRAQWRRRPGVLADPRRHLAIFVRPPHGPIDNPIAQRVQTLNEPYLVESARMTTFDP